MSRIPLLLVGLFGAGLAMATATASSEGQATPSAVVNPEDCKTCHESAVAGLQHTAHAGVAQRCESCHLGAAAPILPMI